LKDSDNHKVTTMNTSLKKSLSFLSLRQRIHYFTLVSIRALASLLDILGIALIGLLAGVAANSFNSSKSLVLLGFSFPQFDQKSIILLVLCVLGIFALKAVIAISLAKAIAVFLAKVESEQSSVISRFLFTGSLMNFQRFNKSEITWAVMSSSSIAFSGLLTSLSILISEGTLLILVTLTFFVIDPVATIFVIVYFGIVIGIIQFAIGRALKKAGSDATLGSMQSMSVLNDVAAAFREIAVLNKSDFFINEFKLARFKLASSSGSATFLNGMPRYVVETALMLGVVIFVGFQFATGQLASGFVIVGVFLTGGVKIMASLLPLQGAVSSMKIQVEQSQLALELLSEATQKKVERTQTNPVIGPIEVPEERSTNSGLEIKLEKVNFSYSQESEAALKDINLHVQSGQHIALIGPSGAGKTTLVDLILGLLKPTSGKITIKGVGDPSESMIKQGLVSYVPQRPGIIAGSIAENIALGVKPEEINHDQLQKCLRQAHLHDFVDALPEGVNTSVGSQANALSGGQIQRLGLARALYTSPRLLVLDEATSALDAISEAKISESLSNLGSEVTVIVIAHRLSTVQHSDNVFVIENGQISGSGSFSHLRKTVPMVAEYVKLMSFSEISE
jgi:ATP-binding cassette, subfamily B, bacterial PglK